MGAVDVADKNSECPHATCCDPNRETRTTSDTSLIYPHPPMSIFLEVDLMMNVRSCDDSSIALSRCCAAVEHKIQSFPLHTVHRRLDELSWKMNGKTIRDIRRHRAMEFYASENLCTKLRDFADERVELLL